jgi:phospholipid-translocating ATPase
LLTGNFPWIHPQNLIITIPLFLYQFYCGFSNSYIIDFNYLLFYQTFFTALSVIGLGIFDRDLDSRYAEDVPPLHIYGIKQHWFNARRFWLFMFEGIAQSVILYFFVIAAYGEEVPQSTGWISDQMEMGTTMAIAAIVNANLFVGINSSSW